MFDFKHFLLAVTYFYSFKFRCAFCPRLVILAVAEVTYELQPGDIGCDLSSDFNKISNY